jgi:hypothetical protein
MIKVAIPASAIHHVLPRLLSDSAMLDISASPEKERRMRRALRWIYAAFHLGRRPLKQKRQPEAALIFLFDVYPRESVAKEIP